MIVRQDDGFIFRGHLVRPDGTGLRPLSSETCGYHDALTWEPFGRYLAVLTTCSIELVAVDGTLLRTIGEAPYFRYTGQLLFAPDGRSVYAAARDENSTRKLRQIPVDGSPVSELQPDPPATWGWLQMLGPTVRPGPDGPPPLPRHDDPPADPDPGSPDDPAPPPPPSWPRPEIMHACPRERIAPTWFRDAAEYGREREAIDCAVWWRVMGSPTKRRFEPGGSMTRGQVATLLVRMITQSGRPLPPARQDCFRDDDGLIHEDSINRLCRAGVVESSGRRFDPAARIRRDALATLVVAAFEYASGEPLPAASQDHFDDDGGSVHQDSINRAAEAELIQGVAQRRYDPSARQRRDDMAKVVSHFLDVFVEAGRVAPPRYGEARIRRVVDGDTFIADVHNEDGTVSRRVRVRMAGINAPERGTCGAREARLLLKRIENRPVRVSAAHLDSVGVNNRPIRFVHTRAGPWVDMSHDLLRLGHATWMPHIKEPANSRLYHRTARRAAAKGHGIWNNTACGYGPQQNAKLELSVRSNPPGPDRNNLNGEYVRIRNTGTKTVHLGGWSLRDSFPRPLYHFVRGTKVPPGKTLFLHVGSGADRPLRKYWGLKHPRFRNAARRGAMGDGAYLYDPHGDLRFWHTYPCPGTC